MAIRIKKIDKTAGILLATIALAVILRIYDLGAESLWFDEIGTIDRSTRSLAYLFIGDHIGPLYHLVIRLWVPIFGVSEISVRLPAVIFSIGSLILTYKVGTYLFSKKIGLISTFLLALSPFHIFYSQDSTNYSLFIFCVLLSMWFFIKSLDNKTDSGIIVCYVLASILALYTNLLSVFVIFIQNIFFLIKRPYSLKRWFVAQLIILFCFLAWCIPLVSHYIVAESTFFQARIGWIPEPSFSTLVDTVKTFCYGGPRYGGLDCFVIVPQWVGIVLCFLLSVLFFLGLFSIGKYFYISFLGVWIFLPMSVLLLVSVIFTPVYMIRYIFFSLPAVYIIIAKGVERVKNKFLQLGILFLITVLMIVPISIYYTKNIKIPWKKVTEYIGNNLNSEDIIIISEPSRAQIFGYYGKTGAKYLKDSRKWNVALRENLQLLEGGFIWHEEQSALIGIDNFHQLKKIVSAEFIKEGKNNIWLILTRWAKYPEEIKKYLGHFYEKKIVKKYEGVSVYCYIYKK